MRHTLAGSRQDIHHSLRCVYLLAVFSSRGEEAYVKEGTMAVTARFTAPIQVVETPEKRDRIKAIADREGISQAQVVRDIIEIGIEKRERRSCE